MQRLKKTPTQLLILRYKMKEYVSKSPNTIGYILKLAQKARFYPCRIHGIGNKESSGCLKQPII